MLSQLWAELMGLKSLWDTWKCVSPAGNSKTSAPHLLFGVSTRESDSVTLQPGAGWCPKSVEWLLGQGQIRQINLNSLFVPNMRCLGSFSNQPWSTARDTGSPSSFPLGLGSVWWKGSCWSMVRLGCVLEGAMLGGGLDWKPASEDCIWFGALQRRGIKEFLINEESCFGHLGISVFRQQQNREF